MAPQGNGVSMTTEEADAGREQMVREIWQRMERLWFLERIRPSMMTCERWEKLKAIEGMARLLASDAPTCSFPQPSPTGGNTSASLAPGEQPTALYWEQK
jgi:hypothetical protein